VGGAEVGLVAVLPAVSRPAHNLFGRVNLALSFAMGPRDVLPVNRLVVDGQCPDRVAPSIDTLPEGPSTDSIGAVDPVLSRLMAPSVVPRKLRDLYRCFRASFLLSRMYPAHCVELWTRISVSATDS
jgi:hypothetical protein